MINNNVPKCLNSHPLLLSISYNTLVEIQHEVGQ
jgi:hypothetical protein